MHEFILFPLAIGFSAAVICGGILLLFPRRLGLSSFAEVRTPWRFGGILIAVGFTAAVLAHPSFVFDAVTLVLFGGAAWVLAVWLIDDRVNLNPAFQLAAQIGAVAILLAGGMALVSVNNPFGGAVRLDSFVISVPFTGDLPFLGSLLLFLWVVAVMNAFNWFDGVDGLAPGTGVVALLAIAFLSLRPEVYQPPVSILASAGAGAALGVFLWNFPKAKIFLGGSGSMLLGFLIAALSVVSGAKIATAALVLALPLIDAAVVLCLRVFRHQAPWKGDTSHVHHYLLARGWKAWQVTAFLLASVLLFGALAVVLPTDKKFIILFAVGALFVLVSILLGRTSRAITKEANH